MKKLILILWATLLVLPYAQAQITKAHSVDEYWYTVSIDDTLYYFTEVRTHELNYLVKIYNQDYSLYRIIDLTQYIPDTCSWNMLWANNYYQYGRGAMSKRLFNSDNKMEFCFYTQPINYSNKTFHPYIVNENGNIVHDFGTLEGSCNGGSVSVLANGSCRLNLYSSGDEHANHTEIYTLPGKCYTTISEAEKANANLNPPFPNPSRSTVNLPYQLQKGEIAVMQIYNINGQLMEQKQIEGSFDHIMLNVSHYPAGVYIYTYNGISQKFIIQR